MTAPYTYTTTPGNPSTYSFKTFQGRPAEVRIPTALGLSGYTLTLEVDTNSRFRNAKQVGSVIFSGDAIKLSMTAGEVDALKDGQYRIRASQGDWSYYLVEGDIDYNAVAVDDEGILDSNGQVRPTLLPPLVAALDDTFLRRDEFVAGVVDPAVLEQAVQAKLNVHIQSPTPHPAYDIDMQDLTVLFENRLK